jgi:hypothetical protein
VSFYKATLIVIFVLRCLYGDFSGTLLLLFVRCSKHQTFPDTPKHWTLSLQVGYAEKICNVWTEVAEDAMSYSGRFAQTLSSVL